MELPVWPQSRAGQVLGTQPRGHLQRAGWLRLCPASWEVPRPCRSGLNSMHSSLLQVKAPQLRAAEGQASRAPLAQLRSEGIRTGTEGTKDLQHQPVHFRTAGCPHGVSWVLAGPRRCKASMLESPGLLAGCQLPSTRPSPPPSHPPTVWVLMLQRKLPAFTGSCVRATQVISLLSHIQWETPQGEGHWASFLEFCSPHPPPSWFSAPAERFLVL